MSTKQDKFYDTLRQTQANTFSDGLNMDLHPLTTPNTILTDCINGTMITYNDNEFVLQNERGNSKIDNANLSPGFIPVGMKEHNGILYIVSHNPQTKKTEIGTFPSPKQVVNFNLSTFNGNANLENVSYYTEYTKDIMWYDYNLSVSNYDKYKISIDNRHPLIVLEHFILDKQGNITKATLSENNEYRFTHVGEGVLGYKYRPYFLSSVSINIDPVKGAKSSQIVITITSDDEELWKEINGVNSETENLATHRKIDEFTIDYDVTIKLLSDTVEDLEIDYDTIVNNINIYDWDYTYNLTRTDVINLKSLDSFILNDIEYKYDFREGVVIKMDGNIPSNEKYNKIKFIITPKIQKDPYTVIMDHLKTESISDVSNIFSQESWFSKFQYQIANKSEEEIQPNSDPDDIFLDFNITLDLTKYDVNWEDYEETDIKEASYKLSEIDDNGNLIGLSVPIKKLRKSDAFYPIVDPNTASTIEGFKGLIIEYDRLNYKDRYGETKQINLKNTEDVYNCKSWLTTDISPKFVKYVREDKETYNIELYDEEKKFISKENIYSTLFGDDGCLNDMEENFQEDHIEYIVKSVKLKKNKIYLFEFTFPIFNHTESILKQEKASFIVVTADYMLNLEKIPDRMDEIQLSDWFGSPYMIKDVSTSETNYITQHFTGKYKNNTIDLEEIILKQDDVAVKNYAKKFFLKYNSLFDTSDSNMLPSISQRIKGSFSFNNISAFNCLFNLEDTIPNEKNDQIYLIKNGYNVINKNGTITMWNDFVKKISLTGTAKEYKQTVERKYLWDLFKEYSFEPYIVKCTGAFNSGDAIPFFSKSWQGFKLNEKLYITTDYDGHTDSIENIGNYIEYTHLAPHLIPYVKMRKGGCSGTSGGDWIDGFQPYEGIGDTGISIQLHDPFTCCILEKIKCDNYTTFADVKEFIHILVHGKKYNKNVLVGISLLNDSGNTKAAYDAILKHAYYLNDINKTVYQYTYTTENIENDSGESIGSQIKIAEESPIITNIKGSTFPSQCIFINKDHSSYNIQSYNNLNYNNLQNVNLSVYDENSIVFEEFNEKYIIFLRELGNCLNDFYIPAKVLQQYNNSSLYFDYDSGLFDNDGISYNLFNNEVEHDGDTNFYKPLNSISNPYLKYDRENNILYTDEIKEDKINQFEYTGGDCISPLKWNYSLEFDEFWKSVSVDSIDELNKYHSLLFYRYSSYADE